MSKIDEISELDKPDIDLIEKIEDSEETPQSILSADLEELEEFEEFSGDEDEFSGDDEDDEEDEDDLFDELLNDDLVDYLDEICMEVDTIVLEKILKSNSGYTESQMAVLRYNDSKVYYLADYDGGNTLRTDVGDFKKGDSYDIVSVQVAVATITNKDKDIPDVMPDDIELLHFNMESDFSMEFYETYEDAEALYGDSEDDDSEDDDSEDDDSEDDESEDDNSGNDQETESSDTESSDTENDKVDNDVNDENDENDVNNNSSDKDEEDNSDDSSVDSIDPENVLWEGQLKDILQ